MALPSTRLGVGLLIIASLVVSALVLGAAWELESDLLFLLGTLLLGATACGAVALALRIWPEIPGTPEPGAWEYIEALGILMGFFGLWLTVADSFGPADYESWSSLPMLEAESVSLDSFGEQVVESTDADGSLRLELRLPGRRFRHQGAVPFEVRLCGSGSEPPQVPALEAGEESLHFRLGGTEEAPWTALPVSPSPLQEDASDEASLPEEASGACLVHRDELLSRAEPPAPGTHHLAVRWAGLVTGLEIDVEARVVDGAWLLAPDVIAWQDGYTEVHTPFEPSTGALRGGPVVSARPPPDFDGPVVRWLQGRRGEPRWLFDATQDRGGLDSIELWAWDSSAVGSRASLWWMTHVGKAAPSGLVLGSPTSAELNEAVILVGYVTLRFSLGRPSGGLVEWVEGPVLEPGQLRRGLALLWTDAGSVKGEETQLLAVGERLDEDQLLFGFSVPHASGTPPTYSGELHRYPPGSAWASDRALWLTFSEEGQQVLTRVESIGGPEPRWELGAAHPGRLRGARYGAEGAQILLEDGERRWVILSESGPPCPLPDDPLLAVFLDDGRLLAAHADGLRVHAPACPSTAVPPAEPAD